MTVRQYAVAMRRELLRLNGIATSDPRANGFRVSDREAATEIALGLSPERAAYVAYVGYDPEGGAFQHAAKLSAAALRM